MQQELIEMLEKVLNWYDYIGSDSYYAKDTGKLTEEAEALIKKAKNNAPSVLQGVELRKELDSANDFIKSLADLIQKYETMLGYRTTNAPEGAYALAEAKGESSVNTELDLACTDCICQHDFALDPKSSIRICLKCGTPERLSKNVAKPEQEVGLTDRQFDLICQAIDKADTVTMDGDYMLDSDDCIRVVRIMQVLFDIAALRAKKNKL